MGFCLPSISKYPIGPSSNHLLSPRLNAILPPFIIHITGTSSHMLSGLDFIFIGLAALAAAVFIAFIP
jgi:hypothetical protein